jgi:hypothetical protein
MKQVRVIAGPTGPTGTFQGVRVLDAVTGASGQFAQWGQLAGPTGAGIFETVWEVGPSGYADAPTGTFKTVIIDGYTGPA